MTARTDDTTFARQVALDKFHVRARREALRQLDAEQAAAGPLPTGRLIDDPLPEMPPELIPGLLLADGATGIIGQKETGKSLVSLEIQYSLLTGAPLWGRLRPTRPVAATVHFLAEHASTVLMGLYRRLAFGPTHRLRVFGPEDLADRKLLVSRGRLREDVVQFYTQLVRGAGAGLVVFDPLASFIAGDNAENDNAAMRLLIEAMIAIARANQAACLILGHQGKPQHLSGGRPARRTSYATRGASAAEDAMTAVHYLSARPGETYNGHPIFELRPVHYKGAKQAPFVLVRDRETCRHRLRPREIRQKGDPGA